MVFHYSHVFLRINHIMKQYIKAILILIHFLLHQKSLYFLNVLLISLYT